MSGASDVLALQQTAGNAAVQRVLSGSTGPVTVQRDDLYTDDLGEFLDGYSLKPVPVDQLSMFVDDLDEQMARTDLEAEELDDYTTLWVAIREAFEEIDVGNATDIGENQLHNAIVEGFGALGVTDDKLFHKIMHRISAATAPSAVKGRATRLAKIETDEKASGVFKPGAPVATPGNQQWLLDNGVGAVSLSNTSPWYRSSFDAGQGQYSREYDVALPPQNHWIIHIHWSGDGTMRAAKLKTVANRGVIGTGRILSAQALAAVNAPVQGQEHLP